MSSKRGTTGLDQSTKQRVVGIAVILIAAVVILPVLFDGQGSYDLPIESRIPEPTPFPVAPRIIPERPVIVADTDQIRLDADAPAASTEPVEPVAQTNNDAEPTPVSNDTDSTAAVSIDDIIASLNLDSPLPDDIAPNLDAVGLPDGWSVRLASFSNEANALNLLQRLQGQGHRAYTRQIPSEQGPLTAVFVGPSVDRGAAQQLQQQLQEQFQLAGIVVRYEIEEL